MRIGILLRGKAVGGGIGTYTHELVRELLALDRSNEYVAIYPRDDEDVARTLEGFEHVRHLPTRIGPGYVWDHVVVPQLAERAGIDLLFSPFHALPYRGSFRKVLTIHGVEYHIVPEVLDLHNKLKWIVLEKFGLPRADRILCVSETLKDDLCRTVGIPPEKVSVTYLGVKEIFRPIEDGARLEACRREHGLDRPFLLFVGHLFPNKNMENLLRALALLRDRIPHELLIVGGRRWKHAHIDRLIEELALRDRVRFIGPLPQDELVALYNLASCFTFPSFYETFGLAMVEAMACGCPVVASTTGALREIAGDAAVYADPHDPQAIARAIEGLIGDDARRREYGRRARARSMRYRWRHTALETLRAFCGVMNVPLPLEARKEGVEV